MNQNPLAENPFQILVQQGEGQKTESPHDFSCRVVNEFPVEIMEAM